MITWILIGLSVEIVRMVERYLRKLWTFKDFKENPWWLAVVIGNLIATAFIWPVTIILEIVGYFLRKRVES